MSEVSHSMVVGFDEDNILRYLKMSKPVMSISAPSGLQGLRFLSNEASITSVDLEIFLDWSSENKSYIIITIFAIHSPGSAAIFYGKKNFDVFFFL